MARMNDGAVFYGPLARWWPLISPFSDYTEEASYIASLIETARRPVHHVLELGSGGGHVAGHLREAYSMTLVDLSPSMLEVSQRLNPDCEHLVGDMRSIRLNREFDAVLIHDAIDSMLDVSELREALETAFSHCRPGGIAVFLPDHTTEAYEADTDHGGTDAPDGRSGIRFLEWSWDPDPFDTWTTTEYAFVLRDEDGTVQVVHDTLRSGLFPVAEWLELLGAVGFDPEAVIEETTEDRHPRTVFLGKRPV